MNDTTSTSSQSTTDHATIRQWTEARHGHPARVKSTGTSAAGKGLLRIAFTDTPDDSLEIISWEDFFQEFENSSLAFLYQDQTTEGQPSRFNKLVNREPSSR